MSICTKRGDEGATDLLFGKRVSKTDARVEACGALDELNAALGVVRAAEVSDEMLLWVDEVQKHLVSLMGVVATHADDHERYRKAGYSEISECEVEWLETMISEAEEGKGDNAGIRFKGWVRPGAGGKLAGAYLDMARTICRRAERSAWAVPDEELALARKFLNRLSDALWLVARLQESENR